MHLGLRWTSLICIISGTCLPLAYSKNHYIPAQIDALNDLSTDHIRFVVLPDRTGGVRQAVFLKAIEAIRQLDPDFVVTVGDQIPGYTEDVDKLNSQWDEYFSSIEPLEFPFLMTAGNHDNLLPEQKKLWRERLGPNFYHYRIGEFLFLHLDSQDSAVGGEYSTGLGDDQLAYLEEVLAANTDVFWTFVLLHQPIWSVLEDVRVTEEGGTNIRGRHNSKGFADNGNWSVLEALLQQRKHTVFAGHEHYYRYETINENEYYTLATAGGVEVFYGMGDGTFDHLTLVSAKPGREPVITNLLLDGILPPDIITVEDGIAINALDELVFEPMIEPALIPLGESLDATIHLTLRNPSQYPLQFDLNCINLGTTLRIGQNQYNGTISPEGEVLLNIPVSGETQETSEVSVSVKLKVPLGGQACYEREFVHQAVLGIPRPGNITSTNPEEDHGVESLIDDDLSTYWASFGQNARFIYTLPEEQTLDSIKLAFFQGDKRKANFEIRASRDKINWECLFEGESSGETKGFEEFRFCKPVTVRYLYFIGHGNTINQWNSVLEMALGS